MEPGPGSNSMFVRDAEIIPKVESCPMVINKPSDELSIKDEPDIHLGSDTVPTASSANHSQITVQHPCAVQQWDPQTSHVLYYNSAGMSCGVPGCANRFPVWTVPLPLKKSHMERWKAAIQAGTGQCPPEENSVICNLHFDMQHPTEDSKRCIDGQREPSLFIRDNVQLRVACCRLCFNYDSTNNLFNIDGFSKQGYSIRQMTNEYFGLLQSKSIEEEYLCEKCTAQLDVTHAFLIDTNQNQNSPQNLDGDIGRGNDHTVIKESSAIVKYEETDEHNVNTFDVLQQDESSNLEKQEHQQDIIEQFEETIVKEETQLTESVYERPKTVHVCKICDKRFSRGFGLRRHIKDQHSINHGAEKPLQNSEAQHNGTKPSEWTFAIRRGHTWAACRLCQAKFQHSKEVVTHLKDVHPEAEFDVYPCDKCEEVYLAATQLNNHSYIHTDLYKCDKCGERNISARALTTHRYQAHGAPRETVSCPFCQKECDKFYYYKHLKIHGRGLKNPFRKKDQRQRPREEKERPEPQKHQCLKCNKCYNRKDRLRKHEKSKMHQKAILDEETAHR